MINLSFNELKLIAQYKNISGYENKSKENLIKVLTKSKPKLRINKNTLKEIKKYFYNLKHKFSKKEVDKYRKVFHDIKNYRHLSESETEETRKNFNELQKSLKSFMVILIVFIRKIVIISMMMIIIIIMIMLNTETLEALEDSLKSLIEIIADQKEPIVVLME